MNSLDAKAVLRSDQPLEESNHLLTFHKRDMQTQNAEEHPSSLNSTSINARVD